MTKNIAKGLLALVLTAALPQVANAGTIVFEPSALGETAGWKPANQQPATGTGGRGYWDQRSYDSWRNTPAGACNAGTIVNGTACDWGWHGSAAPNDPALRPPAGTTADPNQPLEYLGRTEPGAPAYDAPLNFYFESGFVFDWTVLFQLTDWSEDVEFGWYEVPTNGVPTVFNPILSPRGPFAPPEGGTNAVGQTSVPNVPFGFYYRNTRYTQSGMYPDPDGNQLPPFTFFTQSKFNQMGSYHGYLKWDTVSGLHGGNRFDDEQDFLLEVNPTLYQQFALFRQGNRYWLGLEDQIGRLSPAFCAQRVDQPCSDYDFNDLIIGFTERQDVPEPAALALLGAGLLAMTHFRRRR